jgi:hypothetical protein
MTKVLAMKGTPSAAACVVLTLLFGLTSPAQADVTTNLNPGESVNLATVLSETGRAVQIGDKLFDDFFFSYIDTDGDPSDDLVASNVVLTALSNDIGFGLSFQTPLLAVSNVVKDVVLKYSVEVLDPNKLISDAHLSFTATTLGLGTADIGENIYTNGFGADDIGHMEVHLPPPGLNSTNIVFATPQTKIFVEKDVTVAGNGADATNNRASVTIINQTFSQIPEPPAVALVGLGLSGFLLLRRRNR